MAEGIRFANIGLVVGIAITVAGVLVFHDSNETAMQAVSMFGFFGALAIYLFLDVRAKRRRSKRPQ